MKTLAIIILAVSLSGCLGMILVEQQQDIYKEWVAGEKAKGNTDIPNFVDWRSANCPYTFAGHDCGQFEYVE